MRIKLSVKPLVAAAAVVGALAASSSAMAAAPTGIYAPFKYCPYQLTSFDACVVSTSTAGSFKLGNASVPLTAATPVVLQGGFNLADPTNTAFTNAGNGGQTLPPARLKVPGGLIGLVSTGGFTGLLIDAFNAAVSAGNDVYATAELAGPVQFNALNFLIGQGTAVTLPIKVHLENPFLGPSCYIGSNSSPITLRLTTGTTSPPSGTAPITGSYGALSAVDPEGNRLNITGASLVDNTFSVPAASNCGYLPLDKLLITAGVNLREGLPAAAGRNSVVLNNTTVQIGTRTEVLASVH
jgi:hypothetical protein